MTGRQLRDVLDYKEVMDNRYGWRECTIKERYDLIAGTPLPPYVYKIIGIKATKKGIIFLLWFADDEILKITINNYACDAYDVTDVYKTLWEV